MKVPPSVVKRWARQAGMMGVHAIGQAEIAPVLGAFLLWAHMLEKRHGLVFIDNDGARQSLIGLRSQSGASLPLIGATALLAAELGLVPWYERVPGPCNIGDGPSRLDFKQAKEVGSIRDRLELTAVGLRSRYKELPWPEPM